MDRGFLRVLAVDDEPPALDELAYLLRADHRVAGVSTASDVADAFRVLRDNDVDAVFLDIRMPGLDGMEFARVLGKFVRPPAVVFVTAYDDRAAEAFDMGVVDYVRKPIQADRIAESLRRILASRLVPAHPAVAGRQEREDDPTIPVELAGSTRMLPRSAVQWVEAQGDYARLRALAAPAQPVQRLALLDAERRAIVGNPELSDQAARMVLNAAYLVQPERSREFAATADRLAGQYPAVRIELTGPWPPYSFATVDPLKPARHGTPA